MMYSRLVCLASTIALASVSPVAQATMVLGNGPRRTNCWAALDVPASPTGSIHVSCTDGDPSCDRDGHRDGLCTFEVRVCVRVRRVPHCRPRRVASLSVRTTGTPRPTFELVPPAFPAPRGACGAPGWIAVRARSDSRARKGTLQLLATTRAGRHDRDRIIFSCTRGTPPCVENPAGGPAALELVTTGRGGDLDLGSTGAAHNLALAAGTKLTLCLSRCDGKTNPVCHVTGDNRRLADAPFPLLAGDVPMCLVSRFGGSSVTGTADVQSGQIQLLATLATSVYVTDAAAICPRCTGASLGETGTCDGGANPGAACVVDRIVPVRSSAGDALYALSRTCLPTGDATAVASSPLSTTTGPAASSCTSAFVGCTDCTDGACSGAACETRVPDGACVDARGGLSQACCASDPGRPCFPDGAWREGIAAAPVPAWPSVVYPKSSDAAVLAGAACGRETGVATVDRTIGLPAPVMLVLPVTEQWVR